MRIRRAGQVLLVVVVLGLLGGLLAVGVGSALGIRTEPKVVPIEQLAVAPAREATPPPRLTTIRAGDSLRARTAVAELRRALAAAPRTRGTASLVVRHGRGSDEDDSYRLHGARTALRITARSEAGAVRGIYDLALAARESRPLAARLPTTVTSRMPFRMVDLGAAGVTPDPAQWAGGTDYSHYSRAFADAILPEAPYVDPVALREARRSVLRYARHELAEGYNAIAVPGFLEYLTFADVGDGHEIYPEGDDHIARAEAMRAAFGPIWERVHELGLDVYLRTDMLILSTPLEGYLQEHFDLDPTDPGLWSVYRRGLDELYREMPYLDGVVLRIGEGGSIYNLPGWDYYSRITVTTVPAVRAMLTALTDQAEEADKEVIFRTWSVGIGAVGDMHTNPESYHEVLDGLDSPRLVVSTKYSLGDFYSQLPLNETLTTGTQRRIVEVQSRREFEAFGAIPNDLGDLYSQAFRHFLAENPRVEGIWTWTQDGGPWRAGPMTLQLRHGFWQLYDLNTALAVRLARDPDADPAELTADWIRRWLSTDPATVTAVGTALAASRDAVNHGLYIGPYAEVRAFALGLEPPPQMWIFEWDILTGDSAVLGVIYAVARDSGPTGVADAVAEGEKAVEIARRMRADVAGARASTFTDPGLRRSLLDSLDYQVNLFEVLGAYRGMVFAHQQWLDTGAGSARRAWVAARDRFDAAAAEHEARYGERLELPAYNLTAARLGEERAGRDQPMSRLALGGLVVLLLALGLTGTGRTLLRAAARPWRDPGPVSRPLVVAIPVLAVVWSRLVLTWFLAPAHLILVGLGWLVLAAVVAATRSWWVATAVGGAVALRALLLLAVLSIRGPGHYWFVFWTEPGRRSAYVVASFLLFGWVLACLVWAAAGRLGARRAAAALLATVGGTLLAVGLLVGLIGLETALTHWNDQLALLPWGMARILGITTFLGIPTALPWWLALAGAALGLAALALGLPRRSRRPAA